MSRLRHFVIEAVRAVERHHVNEPAILATLTPALSDLVAQDDWLSEEYSQPDGQTYSQYLLYGDPLDRLSILSLVWAPGQETAIHDHRIWGLVGVLRGAELSTSFDRHTDGALVPGPTTRLDAGMVTAVSPSLGDIHKIANAYGDRPSISIHVYGGNIGRIERASYDPLTGAARPVVSRYSNARVPNLWAA